MHVCKIDIATGEWSDEFLSMLFGVRNSGATLVRGMRKLLLGLDLVESYIDDLIIFTKNRDTLLQVLVLCRLQHAHLAFSPTSACLVQNLLSFWIIWLLVAIALR